MHLSPIVLSDKLPVLLPNLAPPLVHGVAELAHRAYAGATLADLLDFTDRSPSDAFQDAALAFDEALAHRLHFRTEAAGALQALALTQCDVYRVMPGPEASARPLRVLAVVAPGDLMVNTPLEFIVRYLDARLDLMFLRPGHPLPCCVPDHDVAFFAVSESDPAMLARSRPLFERWPRPALNDPTASARLSRDVVARGLAGKAGIHSPVTRRVGRAGLVDLPLDRPILVRPVGSHAGEALYRVETAGELAEFARAIEAETFFVTDFVDYRGPDGLFRKYRIAFVDGAPFLCHMAVSSHWMVHYLNAEMAVNPDRRAEEALAMAGFDEGFARRHAKAFAELNTWMRLDYYQIDCAETPDGRLVVFEADVAAIVHLMDPPELFPYKPAAMRRMFGAFGEMLRRAAATRHDSLLATVDAVG